MSDDPHASSSSTRPCATASRRPGFSMDVPAKLTMARALDALGVDIIEAGFPIASPADSEAVRADRARGAAAGDRRAGPLPRRRTSKRRRARSRRPSARASTRSSPPPICTSTRKLRITREACLDAAVSARPAARGSFTDDVEFSAEDATRSDRDFLCRVIEAVDRDGRDDGQPARHGRLRARRTRRASSSRDHPARVPNADTRDLQHALPRRSRAWPSPTASRRFRAACGRSSARSTASASAPATRRSKRS